jgi:hypothetical protein
MDSRRLVVWISTGILGFQGATLAFDLLNCTAIGWRFGWGCPGWRFGSLPHPMPKRVRVIGALINCAQKNPTPIDAAKLLSVDRTPTPQRWPPMVLLPKAG